MAADGLPVQFRIGERPVGAGHPTFVIAEAGANHNRDPDLARELIKVAADAGADAVKFQTYSGERIYSRNTPRFKYLEHVTDKSPAQLLEEISLPREWQAELSEHARSLGIQWFSSPFDHEAVAELHALDVPVLKIASFEIVDLPLIEAAARTGRPLLISTGMSTLGDVEDALRAARAGGAVAVGLMQCTSVYPAPPERANLRAMRTLAEAFGIPVGLSDHTTGISVPIAAAALGAAFVEKHFTLDRELPGPDHSFALEPHDLRAMVQGIKEAHVALGDGHKDGPSPEEAEEMYVLGRRSLIFTRDAPAGTTVTADMLTTKRPGYGIPPKFLDVVVGRRLERDVEADGIVTWDDV